MDAGLTVMAITNKESFRKAIEPIELLRAAPATRAKFVATQE
jgi:hypothetical protein